MYSELKDDRVIVKHEHAHNLYNKRYYGNLTDSGLELSFIEAFNSASISALGPHKYKYKS